MDCLPAAIRNTPGRAAVPKTIAPMQRALNQLHRRVHSAGQGIFLPAVN